MGDLRERIWGDHTIPYSKRKLMAFFYNMGKSSVDYIKPMSHESALLLDFKKARHKELIEDGYIYDVKTDTYRHPNRSGSRRKLDTITWI